MGNFVSSQESEELARERRNLEIERQKLANDLFLIEADRAAKQRTVRERAATQMQRNEAACADAMFESVLAFRAGAWLATERKKARKRARIVREIYDTEVAFSAALEKLLKCKAQLSTVMENEEIDVLFPQIDSIRNVSRSLASQLKKKLKHFHFHSEVGHVFVDCADFLKLFSFFINGYSAALALLAEKWQKSKKFVRVMAVLSADGVLANRNSLESLLITPVQRVPRLVLLLRELLKATPRDHRDYLATRVAAKKLAAVAQELDDRKEGQERSEMMLALDRSLKPRVKDLIQPSRRLVCSGKLVDFTKTNRGKAYLFFLFNDLLLKTSFVAERHERKHVKLLIDTDRLRVVDVANYGKKQHIFQLVHPRATLVVGCDSEQRKREWLTAFAKASRRRDDAASQPLSAGSGTRSMSRRQSLAHGSADADVTLSILAEQEKKHRMAVRRRSSVEFEPKHAPTLRSAGSLVRSRALSSDDVRRSEGKPTEDHDSKRLSQTQYLALPITSASNTYSELELRPSVSPPRAKLTTADGYGQTPEPFNTTYGQMPEPFTLSRHAQLSIPKPTASPKPAHTGLFEPPPPLAAPPPAEPIYGTMPLKPLKVCVVCGKKAKHKVKLAGGRTQMYCADCLPAAAKKLTNL